MATVPDKSGNSPAKAPEVHHKTVRELLSNIPNNAPEDIK